MSPTEEIRTNLPQRLTESLSGALRVERELGGGGMSRVFVAEELKLGRKVVVKVLSPELAEGISTERFEREIRLAASLQHAHIVPVLASGEVDGLPWFTMPFIDGESLRARVGRGPLPMGECLSVLRDVARALAYAHERGVVHRDIKPDNVMLASGTAVVTDFGIAKALSASRGNATAATLTQIGTSIGTPAYMAPEQAAGDPQVDARADLYAFGCTAYEMLSGQSPFAGRTAQRMLAAHLSEVPRPIGEMRPDTPPELATLVMRCLAKEASARPESATEVLRAIEGLASGPMAAAPVLRGGYRSVGRMLGWYVAAFVAMVVLTKAAMVGIGLPSWVLPGALIVMAMGLPAILLTAYVQRVNQRLSVATPTLTPGGTVAPARPQGTVATLALKATPHVSWRRTWRGGVVALGAFATVVALFMLMRDKGIGPFGSLIASRQIDPVRPLLVADFTVSNTDTAIGRTLSVVARATLAQSKKLYVGTDVDIAGALQRMQLPPNTPVVDSVARMLAIRNGVTGIVAGEITGLGPGSGFAVVMRLETPNGQSLWDAHTTARDPAGLIDAVDRLTRKLREKIGDSMRDVQQTLRFGDATTSSFEALLKYHDGVRAHDFERNYRKAIPLLREAVAIDTNFAEAWRKLGIALGNAGAPRSQIDSALSQAFRLRDRLVGEERDFLIATYYMRGPGRDRGRAIEIFESMMRRGMTSARHNLAVLLTERREFARAESLHQGVDSTWPLPYGNRMSLLLRQQKLAEAESLAERAARYAGVRTHWSVTFDNRYRRGDTSGFRRAVDSLYQHGDSTRRAWAMLRQRSLAALGGRFAESRRWYNRARVDAATLTPRARLDRITGALEITLYGIVLNKPEALVRELDSAFAAYDMSAVPEVDRPYFDVASAYARLGRPAKARAVLAQYDKEVSDTSILRVNRSARATVSGYILLAEGKGIEAAREFRIGDRLPDGPINACTICLPQRLALAYDRAGVADSAIVYWERLVNDFDPYRLSENRDPGYLPLAFRRLGELYDAKGDRAKAISYYQRFIALWAKAEPELQPQVDQARTRLNQLLAEERRIGP